MSSLIDTGDLIQAENTATRIPVVLCLDVSYSMVDNGGFEALNTGVEAFFETCKKDSVNKYGFDVAIVTFGAEGVIKHQDFRPIWNQTDCPTFSFNKELLINKDLWIDGTPMGRGVDLSMQGLDIRKNEYKENAIGYYQPWLVIITDGQPTDDGEFEGFPEDRRVADRLAYAETINSVLDLQKNKKLKVIAVGVGNEDYRKLSGFVIDNKVLTTKDFSEFDLVFEYLSKSMSAATGTNTVLESEIEESPIAQIMEDLEDEGLSISIADFGRDED
ncbi:hypothetical protein AGMMS49983_07070 [Clostridia bacterium]|nr:hypothetical protein AGMMS49983_07070 [Clostridia bacterium]